MYNNQVKGNWDEQKAKLKKEFDILTDSDLVYEKGKKVEMLRRLQIKLGKTKEELEQFIRDM
jgi:uncharacterized protein YjbJ (UPF0337 family)